MAYLAKRHQTTTKSGLANILCHITEGQDSALQDYRQHNPQSLFGRLLVLDRAHARRLYAKASMKYEKKGDLAAEKTGRAMFI